MGPSMSIDGVAGVIPARAGILEMLQWGRR